MDVPSSSVSKLIDLLPLIIISVIVLVGFFTWEVFTKHLETFILLITSILFSLWLYSGDIYSYLGWKAASEKGNDQFLPGPSDTLELSTTILTIIIVGVVLILGIGLTLAITSYQLGNKIGSTSNQSNILNYIGYGLLGVGGIIIISLLWKAFKSNDTADGSDANNTFGSTIGKVMGGLISSAIGIYFIVRSNNLKTEESQRVNASSAQENSISIANTVLNVGLILQVVALLGAVYMMYRYKWFHPDLSGGGGGGDTNVFAAYLGRFGPFGLLLAAGFIFIATQQKWITSADGIGSGDDKNNMYAAHGIVYMALAGITLILALGKINTFNLFKIFGWIVSLGVISVIIWNFVTLNSKPNFNLEETDANNGDSYYNQVKDEVTKELKKSGNPDDLNDANIKAKIQERIDNMNKTNDEGPRTVNNVLLGVACVITIVIGVLYAAKMKIVECMKLPATIKNIFTGDCDKDTDFKPNEILKNKLNENPANIEKLTGDDWGKILESFNDDVSISDTNFSKIGVSLASGSRWIPFLTIILVILCVSVLFTKVTTSDATLNWIAKSFRGDMFPKVKELLDSFFIVFIVGLLLCAILLLPMVREQNVGGLDVITKFIDSIQVWQYKENAKPDWKNYAFAILGSLAVATIGLSWWWKYLNETRNGDSSLPIVPNNWEWFIAIVVIFAICCVPAFYHVVGGTPQDDFKNDNFIVRGLRLLFTSAYLVPLLLLSVFKLILYFIPFFVGGLFNKPEWGTSFTNEKSKWDFTKWHAAKDDNDKGTDLRLFGLGKILTPKDVVTGGAPSAPASETSIPADKTATKATETTPAVGAVTDALETRDQTKINAVGKLIKVIFIVIVFVVVILVIIYTVYQIGAQNKSGGEATNGDDEGILSKMNSPTAHTIYLIMAIVGIAGLVAFLREKFKTANSKSPEDYLFNDLKPEDSNNPMRQLTFGMTHIIYIVLMVIVLIYDTEKDDKDRMSVIGMTALGVLILLFHFILEFADNKLPPTPGAGPDEKPQLAPASNLLSNIRFIVNTVFLIALSILAYYKQHGIMIALIVVMFIFHLTKSILGVKLLKFIWSCIIYIPCLFLDLVQSFQGSVGDTTRTIWIIVAIEILLIAILYGGPYLLNYIGASGSQIVARPVSLKQKYDTNLTTQSKQIFIYHNTGINRTPEDTVANCPPEEKKRYQYAISGWFFLNNNVTTNSTDLEIFNFGNVPRMTYNVTKNELKIYCDTLNSANRSSKQEVIYNSRENYNAIIKAGTTAEKAANIQMTLQDEELDADIPLQRWNYFVINYDGKHMDFFLNNKLIFKSNFIMPDIQLKPITIGDSFNNKGLNGSICNFAFHKYPLTKEQIRWTYTMLKSQNPPIIGMDTVEDDAKSAGKTKIYSQ